MKVGKDTNEVHNIQTQKSEDHKHQNLHQRETNITSEEEGKSKK